MLLPEEKKIIVDSCCDMTPQLKKRFGIISIPLILRLGHKEFVDDDSLDLPTFMSEMKACTGKIGTATSTPSQYKETIANEPGSFVVTVSSQLSGSYSHANLGKALADENEETDSHVFDSKSASAGETLVAVKVRELIAKGISKDNLINMVNHFIDNMKTYLVLENYDNLMRSGRLNKITEKLIRILNIKLILGSDGNGNIALHAKVRGINQMIEKMVSYIASSGKKTEGENLVISHCNNSNLAAQLYDAIVKRFNFKEIFVIPTGGVSSLYADDKGIIMAF